MFEVKKRSLWEKILLTPVAILEWLVTIAILLPLAFVVLVVALVVAIPVALIEILCSLYYTPVESGRDVWEDEAFPSE